MEEAESPEDTCPEEALLGRLVEAVRGLSALQSLRDRRREVAAERGCPAGEEGGRGARGGGGGKGDEEEEAAGGSPDEEECICKVLRLLRGVSVSHSVRAASWREALRECALVLTASPPGGSDQRPVPTGRRRRDSFTEILLGVEEEIRNVTEILVGVIAKLEGEILQFHKEEPGDTASSEDTDHPSGQACLVSPETASHAGSRPPDAQPAADSGGTPEEKGEESVAEDQDGGPQDRDDAGGTPEDTKDGELTVGLACSGAPDACFVRGPPGLADGLRCESAHALSPLMVSGSEELVSRVIRIQARDGARLHFPVTVVVPFCGSYRGSYRDVAVKIVDKQGRRSYVTPLATEGTYGGQWGSFAEVRVYCLGLFAVVSCLKKENYTVPTKGLSLKLNADPRICLNYPPGCFATPVVAQTMIQPLDTALLAAAKSRTDAYPSVVSTSPVLYLTHPSSQPLRRPLTLTLPCPPNLEKQKHKGGPEEPPGDRTERDKPAAQRRSVVTPGKSKVISDESLVVLGCRDGRWGVLEEVAARNLQKGLATFELTESFDRLLLLRLLSPLQPCRFTSLAEELEESARSHAVTLVLQRRPGEPHAILVAALPGRDLSWELAKLRAQGYGGPPEASSELSLREGDQLVVRFSGNIAAKGGEDQRLTFHTQLQSQVLLHLAEVDPFGNYSSPHYKGTAAFYRVTGGGPAPADDPVCRLSLTLPKRPRAVTRQSVARVKSCEEPDSLSDSLLLWLSGELSEEEVALLAPSLRLCRSAAQLVKLRAGESPSARAFHVLAVWRRGLPAGCGRPRTSRLARCLARMGRPDLAGELLLRRAEGSTRKSEQPEAED